MFILRWILKMSMVVVFALLGNLTGDYLRSELSGSPRRVKLVQTGPRGEEILSLEMEPAFFVPAVLTGAIARRGWLWAFLVGALSGALLEE